MKNIFNWIAVGCLLLSGMLAVSSYRESLPYRKADKEQRMLQQVVLELPEKAERKEERTIDFLLLQRMNPDIVGWIYLPGTNIDYPILKGEEENLYLDRDYKKAYSPLGSIFTFPNAAKELTDAHICLFGHNTRNKRMFGELKQYQDKEFLETHQQLFLYTPQGMERYVIFSVYECNKADQTFEYELQYGSQEFEVLQQHLVEQDTMGVAKDAVLTGRTQILTLSCCSDYDRTTKRLTIHFRKG